MRFSVSAPFGPITAWAETLDGQYRLGTPIDRLEDVPPPHRKGTPRRAFKRKNVEARRTAKKARAAKK